MDSKPRDSLREALKKLLFLEYVERVLHPLRFVRLKSRGLLFARRLDLRSPCRLIDTIGGSRAGVLCEGTSNNKTHLQHPTRHAGFSRTPFSNVRKHPVAQ